MTELELLRLEVSETDAQYGILRKDLKVICATLELPFRANQQDISSIPTGSFICQRRLNKRTTNGMNLKFTYEVTGILNRSGILFHPGNTVKDTHGCILLGLGFLPSNKSIIRSLDAFQTFLEVLRGIDNFMLRIRNV